MGQAISSSLIWRERDFRRPIENNDNNDYANTGEQEQLLFVVPIQRTTSGSCTARAPIPAKATSGAATFDLNANENVSIPPTSETGGVGRFVKTGLKMALDASQVNVAKNVVLFGDLRGHVSLSRQGIRVFSTIIDADYRDELQVLMFNDTPYTFDIKCGDRVAQLLIGCAVTPTFVDHVDVACGKFGSVYSDTGSGNTDAGAVETRLGYEN